MLTSTEDRFYGIEKCVRLVCSVKKQLPSDEMFIELYSLMRRRPDHRSIGVLHDVVWEAAALQLGLRELSEVEYAAIFAQLARSARHFKIGKDSRNYIAYLSDRFA